MPALTLTRYYHQIITICSRWVVAMKFSMKIAAVCFGMLALCAPAKAIQVDVEYYSHAFGGDFGSGPSGPCCNDHFGNLVQGTLSNGLPVFNSSYGGPTLAQVNGDGTLAWWQADDHTGSNTFSTDGSYSANIFTPNGSGTSHSADYQTAIFTLSLLANTAYTLTYTGDDDVFVALGNQVISQDGGIHAAGSQVNTVAFNTGNLNSLTIFFADRFVTQSSLSFTIEAAAVPGPIAGAGIPGLVMALSGLVAWRRRRRQGAAA